MTQEQINRLNRLYRKAQNDDYAVKKCGVVKTIKANKKKK